MMDDLTSGMSVTVRAATPADAADVACIYNQHIDIGGATFDVIHWTAEAVARLIDCPNPDGWYVAVSDRNMVGWASARPVSPRYGYRHACETAIYLDPYAIGTGVAQRLQQRIEQHCLEHRIHHAVAKIIAENERSIRFHQRFGYELVGIQREIGRVGERWLDVAILQRLYDIDPDDDEF